MAEIAHRNAKPTSIDVHTAGRPWTLILPPVYRYLDVEFVDRFFATGELRLSSFKQFAGHADEERHDSQEGKAMVSLVGADRQFFAMTETGHNSYILCGSTILSKEIMGAFNADAALEITSVADFALSVAWRLGGFANGYSGHCIYAGSRILQRHVERDPCPNPSEVGGSVSVNQLLGAAAEAAQGEDMLLKEARYAHQAEYRLIWNMMGEIEDHVTVFAPEARNFCRKVLPEELN